jgi:hypothetical protein
MLGVMKKELRCLHCCLLSVAMLSIGLAGFWPTPATAQTASAGALLNGSSGYTQPIDVVVLLDDSGSMATCWPWPRDGTQPFTPPCGGRSINPPSDPGDLRYSAARLLLQLAGDNDRVAVVRFDNAAEGIGELGSLQTVGAFDNRQRLTSSLTPPNDYNRRGYTRIDLSLQSAIALLAAAREPGRNQYVLLLTDGEPSGPEGFGGQGEAIRNEVATLREAGVLVFPVVLCNPSAGCAGEFLSAELPELSTRQAATPQDLLRVFSEIFAEMKPDLSVLSSRSAGQLRFTTRNEHGVRKITVVTTRDGLTNLQLGDQPIQGQNVLTDAAVAVTLLEGADLTAGQWVAEKSDAGGFVVVQTDSYPQLLNPPPSLAESPASVRYYPAGKPLLLIARSGGPGASEPLLLAGKTPLEPFRDTDLNMLLLRDIPAELMLQVGADQTPLQLARTFRLEGRTDLPKLAIFAPSNDNSSLRADGHAQLRVGFSGSVAVQNLAAVVFITDQSDDEQGGGQLVYQNTMTCTEQLCSDENFVPGDGRSYQITYLIQAQKEGLRFSDWGQTTLDLKPAVHVRGLPAELDLGQMPPGGWPIAISAGTIEEIGALTASLLFRRTDTGEAVPGVALNFNVEVPERGVITSTLQVAGLAALRPGEYTGEVRFTATRPNGGPMDVAIRPGATLPLSYRVARPLALIDSQLADFGAILFDTSPNFRLDQTLTLPVSFAGKVFKITATLQESSCADLTLTGGEITPEGTTGLPLRLTSRGALPPATCSGVIGFAGPDRDYDVFPQQLDWQMRVDDVEWSPVSSALNLGDLQDAGARTEALIGIRFTGKTPFVLQMLDLNVTGEGDAGPITLTAADLEMSPVEVTGSPDAAGIYEVPVTFTTRRALPRDEWESAFFTGQMTLGIVRLESKAQPVDLQFRSPSVLHRYVSPYVTPIYGRLPVALCAWPLTLLLLLVAIARIRGRDINDVELDEAAVAPPTPPTAVAAEGVGVTGSRPLTTPAEQSAVWGQSAEWGGGWSTGEPAQPALTGQPTNNATHLNGSNRTTNDPWRSSW